MFDNTLLILTIKYTNLALVVESQPIITDYRMLTLTVTPTQLILFHENMPILTLVVAIVLIAVHC